MADTAAQAGKVTPARAREIADSLYIRCQGQTGLDDVQVPESLCESTMTALRSLAEQIEAASALEARVVELTRYINAKSWGYTIAQLNAHVELATMVQSRRVAELEAQVAFETSESVSPSHPAVGALHTLSTIIARSHFKDDLMKANAALEVLRESLAQQAPMVGEKDRDVDSSSRSGEPSTAGAAAMLPCPFCGGTDIAVFADEYGSGGQAVPPYGTVCNIQTGGCGAQLCDTSDDYEEQAIARWNRRAAPNAVAQVVAVYPPGPDGYEVNWLAGNKCKPGDLLYAAPVDQSAGAQKQNEKASAPKAPEPGLREVAHLGEREVKAMVNAFLNWKLPEHFNPDHGISADKRNWDYSKPGWWPIGTNLFDAEQARDMVLHMVSAIQFEAPSAPEATLRTALAAEPPAVGQAGWMDIETAPKDGTEIIGYCDGGVRICSWEPLDTPVAKAWDIEGTWHRKEVVSGKSLLSSGFHPTHWMPLPPSPKTNT